MGVLGPAGIDFGFEKVDPHPGGNLLLEDSFNIELETSTDALMMEA